MEFLEEGLSDDHKFHTIVRDNWPNRYAGYDVTSCFRQLQNAIQYCTKMLKTGAAGKDEQNNWSRFEARIPVMTN